MSLMTSPGCKLELHADGVECSPIFPRHLDDAVDFFGLKLKLLGWHDLILLHCQHDLGFKIRLLLLSAAPLAAKLHFVPNRCPFLSPAKLVTVPAQLF